MFEVSKKTVLLSYVTQFFQYGVTLLILPVILTGLSSEDIGIWYLFLSVSSMVSLLDFGFNPSIQRNVAYVFSGAKKLLRDGYEPGSQGFVDYFLLKSLLYTSKLIYRRISLCILILAGTFGTFYIYYSLGEKFTYYILYVWLLFVVTTTLNFYYCYLLSFVKGRGKISDYNTIVILSKSAFLISLYLLIHYDCGVLSLVVATFINSLITIVFSKLVFLNASEKSALLSVSESAKNLFNIIWLNAKNSGIVNVGVFLFSQTGIFLSGLFLSLNDVAQLGLTLQLFGVLIVICRVYLYTVIPKISSMWISSTVGEIRKLFIKSQIIGYAFFLGGMFVMLVWGNYVLANIIHSNVLMPPTSVILLYGFFYLMEITHGNCCTLISTTNKIPFTKASIVAGLVACVLTIVFVKCNQGMTSFPLALVCGSLPYNSWKWPLETYKLLRDNRSITSKV